MYKQKDVTCTQQFQQNLCLCQEHTHLQRRQGREKKREKRWRRKQEENTQLINGEVTIWRKKGGDTYKDIFQIIIKHKI